MGRLPEESRRAYMLRTSLVISAWYKKFGLPRLHHRLLQAVHRWGHEILTFRTSCGDQPLSTLLTDRNLAKWHLENTVCEMLDPNNSAKWRHQKPGRLLDWEQIMVDAFGLQWMEAAAQADWRKHATAFIEKICDKYSLQARGDKPERMQTHFMSEGAELQLGMWSSEDLREWHCDSKSFECWVDNQTLAMWCNAAQEVRSPEARVRLETLVNTLAKINRLREWSLKQPHADWVRWVPRHGNWVSDLFCNLGMDEGASMAWIRPGAKGMSIEEASYIFTSDGGYRTSGNAAAPWACWRIRQGQATLMACGVKKLVGGDSLKAEITALELSVAALPLLSSRREHVIPHAVGRRPTNQEVDRMLHSETWKNS